MPLWSHHNCGLCPDLPVLRHSFLHKSVSDRLLAQIGHLVALKPDEGVDGLWDVFWGAC